jgi:magnesium-transporting ATPase (P-type)
MGHPVSEAQQFVGGLSEVEVPARLKAEGYNELPQSNRRTTFRVVLEVLREPMLALLIGGGPIYLALGDLKDALIRLAFALMAVAITVIQETHTERVLEALRALTFFSLVLVIVSLIFVNRSFSASLLTALLRPNRALVWVLMSVSTILGLTLLWPLASRLFGFGPLHADDLVLTLTAGAAVLVSLELLKPFWRRRLLS